MNFLYKIIFLLQGSYRNIYFLGFIFMVISVFEMAGLSLVVTYVSIITNKSSLESMVNWTYVNFGLALEDNELIIYTGFLLVFIFSVKTVIILISNSKVINFTQNQQRLLQLSLLKTYQKMDYSAYVKRNSSEYIYNIQTLVHQYVESVLLPIIRVLSDGIIGISIIIFLAFSNFFAFILMSILFSLVIVIYDLVFKVKMKKYGESANIASKTVIQSVNESLGGLKEIRVLGKEEYFFNKVKKHTKRYIHSNIKREVVVSSPKYLLEFVVVLFLALLSIISLSSDKNSELLIPTLALFSIASLRILPMVSTLINSLIRLRYNHSSVSILHDDLFVSDLHLHNDNSLNINKFESIEFINMGFKYGTQIILENINLKIKNGDAVGIIGKSGSGKTTLIDILLGLHLPKSGRVTINGYDVEKVLSSWKNQVAYLPQEVFLIDDTLESNIALGVLKHEIDKSLISESLSVAALNSVVRKLPKGVHTRIGERGVMLSGGQKQRIAIARAHYHGRGVLIMDESTSSLDNNTEKEIISEIKRLKGVKTMIIIAHRSSTIEHCDYIYEISNGGLKKVEK